MSARFCAACGARLGEPAAGAHQNCPVCATPSYANPVVLAGCMVVVPPGGPILPCARLAPGETIQACAVRALGDAGAGLEDAALALYCTLTDLDRGEVYLVFRLGEAHGPLAAPARGGHSPAWAAGLCARYLQDRAGGRAPVYTASVAGRRLELCEVPPGAAGLKPRRA